MLVGAGHAVYLLPFTASVLIVSTDGQCSIWDFAFPYVDKNGENARAMKDIAEMRLDHNKYETLRNLYTFGRLHSEIMRYQGRSQRYIPVAL